MGYAVYVENDNRGIRSFVFDSFIKISTLLIESHVSLFLATKPD